MTHRPLPPAVRRWSAVLGAWAAGAAVFFSEVVGSGFGRLTGDTGDARLVTLLHEHWLEVLRGRQSWRTPNFFHPVRHTLGYSDTFVLDQVLYAPLRAIGLDRYLATQWTVVLLSLIGFVGCHRVCTALIGARHSSALVLAWVFTFANNLAVQSGHLQLFAVYWVPLIVLVAARVFTAHTPRASRWWAALAGALLGLLVYSTYYVGWFTIFVMALFAVGMRTHLRDVARRAALPALSFAGAFGTVMVPFAMTYSPTLHTTGGRSFYEVAALSPTIGDLTNVGGDNVIWGGVLRWATGNSPRLRLVETSTAITPLLFVSLIACAVLVARRCRGDGSVRVATARSLQAVALVLVVLPVKVGTFSMWRAVWLFVPGARALRAVDRIQIVTGLVAVLAVATSMVVVGLDEHSRPRRTSLLLLAAGALLMLEQWNVGDRADLHHDTEVAMIRDTPAPPAECGSFFILPVALRDDLAAQVDAMIVAQVLHVPTLNGYSGGQPEFWDLTPSAENYLERAARWSEYRGLTAVCAYDAATHRWITAPFDTAPFNTAPSDAAPFDP